MDTLALLPLVTYPDADAPAVAVNAVAMAGALGVRLHAVAINVDIPPVSSALSQILLDVPDMIRKAEASSRRDGEALLKVVVDEAKKAGIAATTASDTASIALLGETAAIHARYHDLALCGCNPENPAGRATAEAIVFGSGRPTILLAGVANLVALDHVAIAWDGSRVAARAVADAAGLLARAKKVTVLTVVDEKRLPHADPAERLAEGLRARGVAARALSLSGRGEPIAIALQAKAVELGAGILVMGAFGHSRMRDFVLGGATDGVLSDLRLPVLLSH